MTKTASTTFAIIILLNSLSAFAQSDIEETVIYTKTISREMQNNDGHNYTVRSELYQKLIIGDECAQFDQDKVYAGYRLETVILSPSKNNAAAFTEWYEGTKSSDKVTSVVHQTCYGVGLKADTISAQEES